MKHTLVILNKHCLLSYDVFSVLSAMFRALQCGGGENL